MKQIKPYLLVKSKENGFDFYYYLHIQGGSGHGKTNLGGAHNFYVFYLLPDTLNQENLSPEFFCKSFGVPCGVGDTIEEAHNDFIEKLKTNPLK